MIVSIKRYSSEYKNEWDNFVNSSKNGVFFFLRDYVEYHSHRFIDYSLMFYFDKNLIAVLPANLNDNVLFSHGGLSFGGMVLDSKITTLRATEVFLELWKFLQQNGITEIIYKCIPSIYHIHPAEEDLYSLYQADALLIKRLPSAVIRMDNKIKFQNLRQRDRKSVV